MKTGVIVPVMKNFSGFTKLMESIDVPVLPLVENNWDNNRGVAPAWNSGIRRAIDHGCDYVVIINDDAILSPGTIPLLTRELQGDTVVASPRNSTGVGHPRGLNFWCFAIKPAEFINRFGWFDENFAPAYFEDDDMAYRIRLGGGTIKTIDLESYHAVQGTQAMNPDEPVVSRDIWDRNLKYFSDKWGGHGGYETFRLPFNDRTKTIKDW